MQRTAIRRRCLVFALLTSLFLAGCGNNGKVPANAPEARNLLIEPRQLPEGYSVASGSADMGRPQFCGVAVDPAGTEDFAKRRYGKTISGPFLYQYVFISPENSNENVMERLSTALKRCSSKTFERGGRKVNFDVIKVNQRVTKERASVSFRIVPRTGEKKGYPAEYSVVQEGEVLILLAAFSFFDKPSLSKWNDELITAGTKAAASQLP